MTRRRLPVAAVLALVLAAPAGAGDSPLAKRLARALAVPHVSQARTGAVAIDLQTGETVFSEHDALPLVPASNEKLAIAYGALVTLGSGFRISTDVLGRGVQDGTVWRGSLVLVGHGDPTLSSAGLAALARQVRAAGIRKVTRGVFGDESFFDARRTGAGWKSWFYVNECPPLSALTVERGRYLGRASRDPALAAALLFGAALRRAGVAVTGTGHGTGRDDDVPLASVESPPLARIVAWMGRVSDNFTAELLLKQLGAAGGEAGTSAGGAAVVRGALADADVPLGGVRLMDGSGLSSLDRLTARALSGLLRLSDRMRTPPARGNVQAKTGTTALASALSGYVKRRYVFSVLQNGSPVSSFWARRAQDRFATALASQ
jgi:D-alanyl-D-alanine carboxypeptidase/D-alanyl-D-alanine-endopeptidase (penicillin-binding protein 4)